MYRLHDVERNDEVSDIAPLPGFNASRDVVPDSQLRLHAPPQNIFVLPVVHAVVRANAKDLQGHATLRGDIPCLRNGTHHLTHEKLNE